MFNVNGLGNIATQLYHQFTKQKADTTRHRLNRVFEIVFMIHLEGMFDCILSNIFFYFVMHIAY